MTIIYSNPALGNIGFVDITDPRHAKPSGAVDVGGKPTGVTVLILPIKQL